MNNPRIKFKSILYPGILILTVICITLSAIFTVRFLTSNINAAFDVNKSALEASTIKVNTEDYKLAAKKLNILYPSEPSSPTPQIAPEERQ